MYLSESQIEERVQRSILLFMQGYNCSQAVFCALADLYDEAFVLPSGQPSPLAFRVSASFGGGIGRMRLTCGAVTGMCMLAGMEAGQTEPDTPNQKLENYRIVQSLADDFRLQHGSIICSELLQLRKDAPTPPVPDTRNEEYYRKRPCLRQITSAVRIYCNQLNNHFVTSSHED